MPRLDWRWVKPAVDVSSYGLPSQQYDAGVPVNSRGSYPQPDRAGTDTRSQNVVQ